MKTLNSTIYVLLALTILPFHFLMAQEPADLSKTSVQDSISMVSALAASDEKGTQTLFNGIIPPAPQSLALARYAEYPVSHTTGIPDISIPLYEIHIGDYTLPISISYHSSGARVDDVPTCVGHGWTLNAGGAVIRTILGAPDQPMGISQNRKYMDVDEVRKLITEKKGEGQHGYRHILRMLLENNRLYDTESDRYSYNVAGLTGLFRYDIGKGEFVTLDHAPHIITFHAKTAGSEFIIMDAVGNEYELGKNEVSCLNDDGNGNEYTTAWYVDKVKTPHGDIWGYYNGGSATKGFLPEGIATQLEDKLHHIEAGKRDRSPKLQYTRMGTLKTVQFPTGGSVTYYYELNSALHKGNLYTTGS